MQITATGHLLDVIFSHSVSLRSRRKKVWKLRCVNCCDVALVLQVILNKGVCDILTMCFHV